MAAKKKADKTRSSEWTTLIWYTLGVSAWVAVGVIASQFIVALIMIMILIIVNGGGISDYFAAEPTDAVKAASSTITQPVWTAVYSAISYSLAMALIILVPLKLMRKQKKKQEEKVAKVQDSRPKTALREELGLRGLFTWTDIGLAPVGFIVYLLLAAGLTALFSFLPWFDAEQAQNVGFDLIASSEDRIIAFITLVIMAPIAEEIIFRGWLYGKLRSKYLSGLPDKAGMVIAIMVVSLLFGLVHMQWNVGVNVFALSIVLCALREITGTIYAGILLHMIKNGVAFYLLYVLGI